MSAPKKTGWATFVRSSKDFTFGKTNPQGLRYLVITEINHIPGAVILERIRSDTGIQPAYSVWPLGSLEKMYVRLSNTPEGEHCDCLKPAPNSTKRCPHKEAAYFIERYARDLELKPWSGSSAMRRPKLPCASQRFYLPKLRNGESLGG